MESSALTIIVLPVALGLVMLGMGLTLSVRDFKNVAAHPKAVAVGLFGQLILLPLLAFFVASMFLSDLFAVGLVLVACCPGGVTSNALTFVARGNVALSVSLTAVSSVVAPFVIPIIVGVAISRFTSSEESFSLPLVSTIGKIMVITIIPVALGMLLKVKFPKASARSEKGFKIFSILFLLMIIAGIVKNNWDSLPSYLESVALPVLVLNLAAMSLGVLLAMLAGLNGRDKMTIGLEVGIQNGTTALVIAYTILENPTVAIPPAVYSLLMFASGALFVLFCKKFWQEESTG